MNWLAQLIAPALARFLARSPRLVSFLIDIALRSHYVHIKGADGTTYMERYWLIKPRAWLPFSTRIHFILRPDSDRALHDHPFAYRTFILDGWYVEEDVFGKHCLRDSGETVAACAKTFHRIVAVPSEGVTTLFFMGRRTNPWGFIVNDRKVGWKEYLGVKESS